MKKLLILLFTFLILLSLCSCSKNTNYKVNSEYFEVGYASKVIEIPTSGKLYIAGYHQKQQIEGVLDYQEVDAIYINGILLISIDSIGISLNVTNKIREGLKEYSDNVNVFSTHTHAGIDTLGLWGGVALDGKNDEFMSNLVKAAIEAGIEATQNKEIGDLYYGYIDTEDLQYDSRNPIIFDANVYQFRFKSRSGKGIRLINYAAHAESLRGDNYQVSADYVGEVRRLIKEKTFDDVLFIQGAIGGLIMTKELVEPFDALLNMQETGKVLTSYILGIDNEIKLSPSIELLKTSFKTKLDNTLYMYYKFLGILENELSLGNSMTGYLIKTESSILVIDNIIIYLVPGEIFPELVYSTLLTSDDPDTLESLAFEHDYDKVLVFGLANDELGYIIPKSEYLLNEKAPYINTIEDVYGENHYEETNSTSSECAYDLYEAYRKLLK